MYSNWLKEQFLLHPDKKKSDLAKAMGVDSAAISKILSGDRGVKGEEHNAMRRFFGLPVDGENATQSPADRASSMPDAKGASESIGRNIHAYAPTETPHAYNVFNVTENIMEPDFPKGSRVLVDLSETFPAPAGTFVLTDGATIMLRDCEVITGSQNDNIIIKGRNPAFEDQTLSHKDIAFIGRVIGKIDMV